MLRAAISRPTFQVWTAVLRREKAIPPLIAVFIGLCVGTLAANASAASSARARRPIIISVTYGRFQPAGSPRSYFALRLRAREPRGQIVEADYQEIDNRGIADGIGGNGAAPCGLGGQRNGRVETKFLLLTRRLRAGRHRIRVVVYGGICVKDTFLRSSSRIVTIQVPPGSGSRSS